MTLIAQNILQAIQANPITIAPVEGSLVCAMQPFGCTGYFAPERATVKLADSSLLGLCANYRRHTTIVREAGAGSEAQRLFTWIIGQFQAHNPDRPRGATLADAPIKVAVLAQ